MGMEINSTYNNYASAYTGEQSTRQSKPVKNVDESTNVSGAKDVYATEKIHKNAREYKSYLTDKYDCLKSRDYGVQINGSLLSAAMGDEKTSKWLEQNLSLIPKAMDDLRASVEARGSKIISCNISVDGYDSMSCELVTKAEADPGTDKTRKEIEERLKKTREEKKAEEKKEHERLKLKKAQRNEEEKEESEKLTIKANNTEDMFHTLMSSVSEGASGNSFPEGTIGYHFNIKA